jgi:hypothetical protein
LQEERDAVSQLGLIESWPQPLNKKRPASAGLFIQVTVSTYQPPAG